MANHATVAPSALISVFFGEIAGFPVQLCNTRDIHTLKSVQSSFIDSVVARRAT
jgi:hypothetical protein